MIDIIVSKGTRRCAGPGLEGLREGSSKLPAPRRPGPGGAPALGWNE